MFHAEKLRRETSRAVKSVERAEGAISGSVVQRLFQSPALVRGAGLHVPPARQGWSVDQSRRHHLLRRFPHCGEVGVCGADLQVRSEEHTSELQSLTNLVCRLLLEK